MASTINASTSPTTGIITTADSLGALALQSNGTTALTINSDASTTLASYQTIKSLIETATITASAPSSTTNFDVITQAVQYYTSNTANNWTLNIRGNSSTSLNTLMSTGQVITITMIVTNSSTAYYQSALQIDGSSVTPKWQGGTAPSSGNASACDIYTYAIVKTGSATFTVFASQTKFA